MKRSIRNISGLLLLIFAFSSSVLVLAPHQVYGAIGVDFVPIAASVGKTGFTGTVTGSNFRPFNLTWDVLADGIVDGLCTVNTGSSCHVSFVFPSPGTFAVKVTAKDRSGASATVLHNVTVTRPPPIGIVPSQVRNLSPGTLFSVKIIVGNSTNPVNDLDAWQVVLQYNASVLTALSPVSADAAGYNADPPFNNYAFYRTPVLNDTLGTVDLGAGFVAFPTVGPSGSGALAQVDFMVKASGVSSIHFDTVSLRSEVLNANNSATVVSINPSSIGDGSFTNLSSNPPLAIFSVTFPPPLTRFTDTPIFFDASPSRDSDGFIVSYMWNFDDGNTTTVTAPTIFHRFAGQRSYDVTLTVKDNSTLTTSVTQNVVIVPRSVHRDIAVVAVDASPRQVRLGEPVNITVTVKNLGNITETTIKVTVLVDNLRAASPRGIFGLAPGAEANASFTWDTSSSTPGDHTISARLDIELDEVDASNNILVDGKVTILPPRLSIKLSGETDYLLREGVKLRFAALVLDASTMNPVSNATVTIKIYDDNGTLVFSGVMIEKLKGTGIYEWISARTLKEMGTKSGVYLVRVEASSNGGPVARDILLFHIDPPGEAAGEFSYLTILTGVAALAGAVALILARGRLVSKLRRRDSPQKLVLGAPSPEK